MIEYLETELHPSPVLAIAFTGVMHALGGIPFEFGRSLGKIDCATLLVRDIGCRWYQYEKAHPSHAMTVVNHIRETACQVGAKRIVCIGNSMGGFGALMFGSLLQADAVLAFCPQTVIDTEGTDSIGDRRWSDYQAKIAEYPFGDVARLPPPKKVIICYGADEPLDVAHIERLRWGFSRIITSGGHNAVNVLKDRGELIPLMAKIIAEEDVHTPVSL